MCGILGKLNLNHTVDEANFNSMLVRLHHRGPDDGGAVFLEGGHVALGHRRLSIIDLTESGHQPMSNENNKIWITYNGEIYNYKKLRKELIHAGHVFKSNCDTEVLIHGYEEWGRGMLSRLKGMYAFAIWDENSKKLFLARDRFGIKPLYYGNIKNSFMFMSELKPLKEIPSGLLHIDQRSLLDFLVYNYIPTPKSIYTEFQNCPQLPGWNIISGPKKQI